MQIVERCPDDDEIAYIKLMPNVDHPMRAFGEFPLDRVPILTMVRCPDGWWRAWGLAVDQFPRLPRGGAAGALAGSVRADAATTARRLSSVR